MELLRFAIDRGPELRMLIVQHLVLVLAATAAAVAVGVPVGILLTRRPRLARVTLATAGILQTIPSLALFGFLIPLPFVGGIGARTAIVALIVYALLPILRNTYAGIRQVDPAVVEAATAMGMTPGQRLRMVEIPLALPVILAGVRIAAVVSVGTATIAAAIGAGGLGTYVFRGLATMDTRLILAGAIPAALLAVIADGLLARVERSRRPARAAAILAGLAIAFLLWAAIAGQTGAAGRRVVVVSKNFTEQVLLGEIVAGAIERAGLPVDRRLNLGGTALCHQALLAGKADVYVEYTGTALKDILKERTRSDPREVLQIVRGRYRPLGLEVGAPLGFNNTFALVMRRPQAERLGVRRISDLKPHAAAIRLGLFGEFLEREDGLPGLVEAYGLRFGPPPREMDLGLIYQALLADQVDLVVGSATDGLIAAHDLLVLEDDRRYFPPYDAVIISRAEAVERMPTLRAALAALEGRIDATAMRRMNLAVDGEHRSPAEVARDFLKAQRENEGERP
jgi:osmoprotectant transport system substrate-binding protein/osmoprotectant transport system permease protein